MSDAVAVDLVDHVARAVTVDEGSGIDSAALVARTRPWFRVRDEGAGDGGRGRGADAVDAAVPGCRGRRAEVHEPVAWTQFCDVGGPDEGAGGVDPGGEGGEGVVVGGEGPGGEVGGGGELDVDGGLGVEGLRAEGVVGGAGSYEGGVGEVGGQDGAGYGALEGHGGGEGGEE